MSGFLAVRANGRLEPEDLAPIVWALSHRGPYRAWHDDGVVLVGFDGRRGPALWVEDDLVVAADARIDNRAEIDGFLPRAPRGDAERILLAWRLWRAHALDRLVGDFAGAVWDRRARELTVFRDPVGPRPAILARGRGRVLAGSGIAALLADEGVDRSVDETWLAAYLTGTSAFETRTGFRSMRRLEPGTIARVTASDWRISRWFSWRPERVRERDDAAYAERFRALFDEAVRCRMRGARRTGVMLSGGLDSTSVIASARAVAPDADLVALSMAFDDPRGDERALQAAMAERVDARMRWIDPSSMGPFGSGVRQTLERHGVPAVPPNRFHAELLAQAGADEGIDVALDGIDGDGIVGGNWFFLSDLLVTGRWRTWRREAAAARAVHGASKRLLVRHYSVLPLVPPSVRLAWKRARGKSVVPAFVEEALARGTDLARLMTADRYRPGRSYHAVEHLAAGTMITPLVLEMIDEEWARHGIEVAHPFLDRRLIAFCLGLPREQKIRDALTKIVMRNAMTGRLPAAVAERAEKAELAVPFFAGLRGVDGTGVTEGLLLASSNHGAWFHRHTLDRLLREAREQRLNDADLLAAYRIAGAAHWTRWLREDRAVVPEYRS